MTDQQATEEEWGPDRAEFLPKWPTGKDGNFVKPFVGNITSVEVVKDVEGLNGEVRDVDLYTVADENGERFTVWGSGMLARVLPPHVGHRVKIIDQGLSQQAGGTQLRGFDVRCATCAAAGK